MRKSRTGKGEIEIDEEKRDMLLNAIDSFVRLRSKIGIMEDGHEKRRLLWALNDVLRATLSDLYNVYRGVQTNLLDEKLEWLYFLAQKYDQSGEMPIYDDLPV